jgi:multidrug efflux pump subunit AcrA (membrane-fusion protein)
VTGPVHAGPDGDDIRIDVRLVVAPGAGLFEPAPVGAITAEGEVVAAGTVLGHVGGTGDRVPVVSFCAGFLVRLLVEPGERVRAGQPVAWLHPVDRPATRPEAAA